MKIITHTILLSINLFWAASFAALQPGEGMVLDQATGNYVYSYRDGSGGPNDPLVQIPFIPSTKIEPILTSSNKLTDNWHIRYGYALANGANAKQSIVSLDFFGLPTNAHITGTTTTITEGSNQMDLFEPEMSAPNSDWYGSGARVPKERVPPNGVTNIGWDCLYDSIDNPDPNLGIQPSKELGGFSLISRDLPGLIAAQIQGGGTGDIGFPGFAPGGEILALYEQLRKNDFVSRNAAAPMIAVPDPFDPAVVLERIQTHMHTWIGMSLLDPAFSSQLDRYFQPAIDAYRLNQPQTGKKHIQTMRALIKKEQPDADKEEADDEDEVHDSNERALIGKLAARILDFDLKYVAKRMGGGTDD